MGCSGKQAVNALSRGGGGGCVARLATALRHNPSNPALRHLAQPCCNTPPRFEWALLVTARARALRRVAAGRIRIGREMAE